ncbi:MAG: stage III sporulation protein AB [Clostridia bacterium]|nr:stage III sporulation protein AB [Clostridia bacterium]
MIFIKYFNLGLICFICFYLGNMKAGTFEKRVIELNKFQNALLMFKSKIEFTYEPINNIFLDISKIIYENHSNIFLETLKQDSDIYIAWKKSTEELKDVNTEDKEIIKMFGKLLGKTDIKGQVSQIELTENLIERQIEKAESEKNKNFKLYKTMGIICGMGICIILI